MVDAPVIIVGGGPVGLSTALELEHHGIPAVVVEPRTTVDHSRPRAKTTSSRTMELFRRWGVARRVREAAPIPVSWSNRVTFVDTILGREIAHIDGCLGLTTPVDLSPEPAQQISQGVIEDVLRMAVTERTSIQLRTGWHAVEVTQSATQAAVTIANEYGAHKTLTAQWVIGADGPHSVVRRAIGATYEGTAGGKPNVNITFRSSDLGRLIPHPPSIHYWTINKKAPGVVGPLDLDGTWWSIATGVECVADDNDAKRLVADLVGSPIDVEIVSTDPWQARLLLADHYRSGRAFLVGDSAHQNPPWGGHGFNTGVGDAVNLGWKLAAVLNGWAPEELLETYESERKPIAQRTIEIAAQNMATLSTDLAASRGNDTDEAENIRREKSAEFHCDGLIFGYGYGPSADFDPAMYTPATRVGARLPHRSVDGTPIHDLLGRGFSVLGPADRLAGLEAAAKHRGMPLTTIAADGPVVVVRPDQHIAWVGPHVENADAVLDDAVRGVLVVDPVAFIDS